MNSKQNIKEKHIPKNPLFELIKSMSAPEKRYFNLNAKAINGKEGKVLEYFILFQIINQMEEYDEEKVKKKLLQKIDKEKFPNFSGKKKELYEVLMRQLKNFHYKKMKKSAAYIKELINDAVFLFRRGLYGQANKYLKDAKKMAEECGDTLSLIEINRMEREFIRSKREIKSEQQVIDFDKTEKELIEKLKVESGLIKECDILSAKVHFKNKIVTQKSIENIKNEFSNLKEIDEKDLTIIGKRFLRSSLVKYYNLIGDNEKLLLNIEATFEWWEANKVWRNQMPYYYIDSFSNILSSKNRTKEYNEYPEILEKLRKIETNTHHEAKKKFRSLILYQQLYYLNTGLLDEACNLSKNIEKGLKFYELGLRTQIVLIYNTIIAFFFNDKYKKCIEWTNFFQPNMIDKGKIEIQCAQVFKLISFYEIGNYDKEKAYTLVYGYFINSLKMNNDDFHLVLIRLVKIFYEGESRKKQENLSEVNKHIKKVRQEAHISAYYGLEEIEYWLKSKLENKKIIDLVTKDIRKRVNVIS